MSEESVQGTPRFVESLMKGAHFTIKMAVDGLTDEQLHFRPSEETNSIIWLVWHLYRSQDFMGSALSGKEQVWTSGGWAERLGMQAEDMGFGHTSQQLADFQPDTKLVFDYAAEVRAAFAERIGGLPEGTLDAVVEDGGDEIGKDPHTDVARICMDTMQHAGQIAYLRGLQTGMGWFF